MKKRVNLFLTLPQIRALQAWCAESGLTFGELIRRIIDKALDEYHAGTRETRT